MRANIYRMLGAVVGLAAAVGAIALPSLIFFSEFQGPDPPGRIAAISFLALLLAALLVLVAYILLRFALRKG